MDGQEGDSMSPHCCGAWNFHHNVSMEESALPYLWICLLDCIPSLT